MLMASGMSRPTLSEHVRGGGRGKRFGPQAVLLGAMLALGGAHCTFPEYDIDQNFGAGSGGKGGGGASSNGAAGNGASSGTAVSMGGAGAPTEAGAPGTAGMGGELPVTCQGEQWPAVECPAECLRRYPDHCYDGELSPEEMAVDCGFECQPCTNEECTANEQCSSGQCLPGDPGSCHAPLTVELTLGEQNAPVSSTAWELLLYNSEADGGQSFALKDLELRYYIARGGVIEPIVIRSTRATLNQPGGQEQAINEANWRVERFEATGETAYDAYVSVSFDSSQRLFPGDHLELYQQMLTGYQGISNFDQRSHYSFVTGADVASLYVNVFHQGRLLWGLEPRPANPRHCFARGVNLNGPATTVEGRPFESAAQAAITTDGSGISQGSNMPNPLVSGGIATMLDTATRLQAGQTLTLPAADGEYLAYLYAISLDNDGNASELTVQGEVPEESAQFRAQAVDAGWAWARLGPYRVSIENGQFSVGVAVGAIHFAGIELWYPE